MEKTTRVTKAQRFADIIALLNGDKTAYGTTVTDAVEVMNHEIELLARKNSGENKRQSATQVANEEYKRLIVEFLAGISADEDGVTCSIVKKNIPELYDFEVQKVSSLMRALKAENRVVSYEKKGKTLFRLA